LSHKYFTKLTDRKPGESRCYFFVFKMHQNSPTSICKIKNFSEGNTNEPLLKGIRKGVREGEGRKGENARTENARPENAAPDCRDGKCRTGKCGTNMQGWKMRDLKIRHQTAGMENAGLESAGNDIVWNAAHCLCLLSFA